MYDRIAGIDKSYIEGREKTLKGRLAEAVRDESLKRELRRLNLEMPSLSFFDLRDRAIAWMGNGPQKAHLREIPVVRETVTSEDKVLNLLQQKGKRLDDQQTQIESLLKRLEAMSA